MKKIILYLILVICFCSFVIALPLKECQRTILQKDAPCIVATSYLPPLTCENYNATIINQNNVTVENLTFYSTITSCQFIFTHNTPDIYFWNSSIESGVITVEANQDMMAVIIVFICLITYFAILGWLNHSAQLKFLSFSLSIIELILMIAVIYVSEGGGNYLVLLKINFYSILIVGFGVGMLTIFSKYASMIAEKEVLDLNANYTNEKWGGNNKW